MSIFNYIRRKTVAVNIGGTPLGSDYPIRLQSMASTSTMDTDGSVAQCERIAQAGAAYIRLTAQGVREAENLGNIKAQLREKGVSTPLVADIHFNPRAAFAAAEVVEKVRINPGNFVDPGRTFKQLTYTDEEYAEEIKKIEATFVPFINLCRENNTAIRIGVNHGSLSARMLFRYGDTVEGMVESALEYLQICEEENFDQVVVSLKASNPKIAVQAYRLLVAKLIEKNMKPYPLHVGVTEAGEGEDGRLKSAVGIGTLLLDGLGDTIRVSLTEDPCAEVPVAASLIQQAAPKGLNFQLNEKFEKDPYAYIRRESSETILAGLKIGGSQPVAVGLSAPVVDGNRKTEFVLPVGDSSILWLKDETDLIFSVTI